MQICAGEGARGGYPKGAWFQGLPAEIPVATGGPSGEITSVIAELGQCPLCDGAMSFTYFLQVLKSFWLEDPSCETELANNSQYASQRRGVRTS